LERVGDRPSTEPGDVPFELAPPNDAAIIVPVKINGHGPFKFVLDTGATFTCIDQKLVDQLKLPEWRGQFGIGVLQLPTANSLQVFRDVSAEIGRLSRRFPPGMKVDVAFETTSVVSESIREVVTTLAQAIALVVLVMFLFLQNWRTTLIPAITIPVALIGTFAFVGGGSRVNQDVPPYTKAVGNPMHLYGLNSVGLQRAGVSPDIKLALKRAYRLVFNSDLTVGQGVQRARVELPAVPEVEHFLKFIEGSQRGVLV